MTKILLVEDDKSLREIYGVRLLAEGYDIVSAGDGEEALAMAIKERPQLIVSDVMMPKISGFDMLDILRSTTETKDIKVIMMTALSSEDQRQRGEQLGADRYLVKSQVGIEDVVRTVHDVLGDIPTAAPNPQQAFGTPAPSAIPRSAPQVAARPAAAPAAAAPTPALVGPQEPQESSSLPKPTAPFSTPRPSGLGDRIIHPIEDHSSTVDMSSLIEQELSGVADLASAPAAPAISQEDLPAPSPAPEPAPAAVSIQSPAPAPMPEVAAAPEPNPAPPVQVPPRPVAPNPTSNPVAADPARPFAAPNPAPAATPGGLPMPPEQPPQP